MDRHRSQLACALLGATLGAVVAVVTAACSQPEAAARTPAPAAVTQADTGPGCGLRAVTAGAFNAACAEYQGYLDPGTAAGRPPTSGERQQQHLCETGRAPKSECSG